jgi:DNA-binding CsgD family transcriptional regulator
MILKDVSRRDVSFLLKLINDSLFCRTENDLRILIVNVRNLIPHDFAVCGLAKMDNCHRIKSYEIVNVSYPSEWLLLYMQQQYQLVDPVIKQHFTKFRMQYWADTYKIDGSPRDFIFHADTFGLRDGYTYGVANNSGSGGSLFSFSGRSLEHHKHTEDILTHLVPHLHQALIRILEKPPLRNDIFISEREKEVLKWVKQGKSSWDISVILGISQNTVIFHTNNTMKKLGAVNRTHAVALALEVGLLDF